MKVDTITETQTQFKGLLILKNAKNGNEIIAKKAIPAELVSFEPAVSSIGQTLLHFNQEHYLLKLPFEKVLELYNKVAFKSESTELEGELESAITSSPFYPD